MAETLTPTQHTRGIIVRLAMLDLRHEWILTLCMVLAMAAILAPLLILLGLKYGTIATLRDRLIEDPVNRELRPAKTLQLPTRWFDEMGSRPEVEFIIPTILRGSSIIRVAATNSDKRLTLDLVPSAEGDPLILENGGLVPEEGQAVLTYPAAEQLGVQPGATLTATVTRIREGEHESEVTPLTVKAVLSPRADALPRLYATSAFVADVEAYREGLAVPQRQWPGGHARPFLSFDGLWVLTPRKLSALDERMLTINTGLAELQQRQAEAFQAALGITPPEGYSVYRLSAKGSPIQASSIKEIKNKLRGRSAVLIPFAEDLATTVAGGAAFRLVGLSLSAAQSEALGWPVLPWGGFDETVNDTKLRQALLPPEWHAPITLNAPTLDDQVTFPLDPQGASFGAYAIVPVELIGVLRTGQQRRIRYDATQGGFLLAKAGYRGFRLYARGIDDVPGLYRLFIEQGIEVMTRVQEIEKVKILDRGLTRIFWLVAVVGIVGGMAALVASLYAAVERKKRDISVLRLMGLARAEVFRFPIYQGVGIAVMSVLVAIGGYGILASIINLVFSADLELGQRICTLPNSYFGGALFLTTATAGMSSLLAAWKTTKIDPAEAIREE